MLAVIQKTDLRQMCGRKVYTQKKKMGAVNVRAL